MSQNKEDKTPESDYAPYPKLDPSDINPNPDEKWTTVSMGSQPPPEKPAQDAPSGPVHSVDRGAGLEPGAPSSVPGGGGATTMPAESNPYVSSSPAGSNPYVSPSPASSSVKEKMDSVRDVLGKWGKKAAETTKKYQDTAGNMWQHLKTGPSIADAAVGRIAQGTKVLAEGGYEKIFRQSFETLPEEQLLKSYACYLSTSAGPVMGILYLSTAKLAFCSDSPLSYTVGDQTQWSYYKMVIPLHQLKAINPSTSQVNQAEKYIQIISIDSHEFWFMGFVHYDSAVKNLLGAVTPIYNL